MRDKDLEAAKSAFISSFGTCCGRIAGGEGVDEDDSPSEAKLSVVEQRETRSHCCCCTREETQGKVVREWSYRLGARLRRSLVSAPWQCLYR